MAIDGALGSGAAPRSATPTPAPWEPKPSPAQSAPGPATQTGEMPDLIRQAQPAKVNKKLVAIIAVVILLLGAGSAFGYFYYFSQPLTPEQVLRKMYDNVRTIKTLAYSGDITATLYPQANNAASGTALTSSFNGEADISDLANTKQSSTISLSSGASPQGFNGTAEFRNLGNVFYVKLDKLDFGAVPGEKSNPMSAIVAIFMNQWFKIDPAAIGQAFFKDQADQVLKIGSSTRLSADKVQKIMDMAVQDQVITVAQVLPNETVDGQDAYHYKLAVSKDGLKSFVAAAYPILYDQGTDASSSEQLRSIEASVDSIQLGGLNDLEIWIGAKDFFPHKISANITTFQGSEKGANIILNARQNNFNQPVAIAAPEGAKDVNEMLGQLFGGK